MTSLQQLTERIEKLEEIIEEEAKRPLSAVEAAYYLGLSPTYVYKLTSKKQIPFHKPLGKRIYFIKSELNDWVLKTDNQNAEVKNV